MSYQWQKLYNGQPEALSQAIADYAEGEPTWYNFPLEDKTESAILAENPDATWQGIELYYAIVDALNAINADSSNVQVAWKTPNYPLDGFVITAESTDNDIILHADKDGERHIGTLTDDGKWTFSDAVNTVDAAEPEQAVWQNIDGATEPNYSFIASKEDYDTTYRCVVTVLDEAYKEAAATLLNENGVELTEEQLNEEQLLYSVTMKVVPVAADEVDSEISTVSASAGNPKLSSDAQWITGLTNGYEYITKDTYDRVTKWLNEGKITQGKADLYWTKIGTSGFGTTSLANVLDQNGFPTGEVRGYAGFDLTDGNKLEVNSDWYGKTVYFRPVSNGQNWTSTGTAIKIPAYTNLTVDENGNYVEAASGSKYKKAITVLNAFVPDTGSVYKYYLSAVTSDGLTVDENGNYVEAASGSKYKKAITVLNAFVPDTGSVYKYYLSAVTSDGWLRNSADSDIHITVNAINCELFNRDPARYLMDAEGTYRMDSFAWGVCTYDEPDLSGKAYWELKNYVSQGYGLMIGHDTLYAYAGAYYDAYGKDLDESSIDPNDTTTRYYNLNSWVPNTGHWYVNELMGANGGNVDSGTVLPSDAPSLILSTGTRYYNLNSWVPNTGHWYVNELMGANGGNVDSGTVLPSDAPSLILSTGGSHGKYGKQIQYGTEELRILQTGWSAADALANVKYRTPTNYPYAFSQGQTFPAAFTHTNQQATFGPIWAEYSGVNKGAADYGYYEHPYYWTIGEKTGTNNFYLSTNQQATFGPIWAEYSGVNKGAADYGYYEHPYYWTIGEKTGTNNFYLSGIGNFLMNQIGHLPTNAATAGESRLFANSVMYISQRKQCEICAANQGGQENAHFVRRINSANANEVLTALQNGGTYWYPLDGCYQLTEDITLPSNWTPIKNFTGHWNADVYKVNLNGAASVFDTTGSAWNLGTDKSQGVETVFDGNMQRTTGVSRVVGDLNVNGAASVFDTTGSAWNLGTDKSQGVETVFDGNMQRTTGVSRVVGDLNDLFDTSTSYAGYTVKILGADNPKYLNTKEVYSCRVNSDSKYVISNLPCVYDGTSGNLKVRVYDPSGNEVTQYGPIIVQVSTAFWENTETIPLQLLSFSPAPIKDAVTYEGQAAKMMQGRIYWTSPVTDVQWQVMKPGGAWQNIEDVKELSGKYTASTPKFVDHGDESYTGVELQLNDCKTTWTNYHFRAVFKWQDKTADTYSVAKSGYAGLLTVKPWPIRLIQANDQTVWEGETATFTATAHYWKSKEQGLKATWEFQTGNGNWSSVAESGVFPSQKITTNSSKSGVTVYNGIAKAFGFSPINASRTTTPLTINNCDVGMSGYQFRVHWEYTSPSGTHYSWYSSAANNKEYKWDADVSAYGEPTVGKAVKNREGRLIVNPADLAVLLRKAADEPGSRDHQDKFTPDAYGQKLMLDRGTDMSRSTATYTAIIYYRPTQMQVTPRWEYCTMLNSQYKGQKLMLDRGTDMSRSTATYTAIIYYRPTQMQVTPRWEYCTMLNSQYKAWNQNTATQIDRRIKTKVVNTNLGIPKKGSTYYNSKYPGWAAIKSTLTITNPVAAMYDSSNATKYFFRCYGIGKRQHLLQ